MGPIKSHSNEIHLLALRSDCAFGLYAGHNPLGVRYVDDPHDGHDTWVRKQEEKKRSSEAFVHLR